MLILLLELQQAMDKVKMQKKAALAKTKRNMEEGEEHPGTKKHRAEGTAEGGAADNMELVVQEKGLQIARRVNQERERHVRELIDLDGVASQARIRRENDEADADRKRKDADADAALAREQKALDAVLAREQKALETRAKEAKKAAAAKQAADRASARKLEREKKAQNDASAAEIKRLNAEIKAKVERDKLLQEAADSAAAAAIQREKNAQELEDTKAARKLAREKERHEQDLALAAARRAFINGVAPVVEEAEANEPVPGITIWSHFKDKKKDFPHVKQQKERNLFLRNVGTRAIDLYRTKWKGAGDPIKVIERGFEVYSYPSNEEPLVAQAFVHEYRLHLAGSKQGTLRWGGASSSST